MSYWITRFLFQRSLGFIYFIAFLIVVNQFRGLCGDQGLLPVRLFVNRIDFWQSPSLFWFKHSDLFITFFGWVGLGLSVLAMTGLSDGFGPWVSVTVWGLLWLLYLSFVNVGQIFYGFGWETLLLETGFLTIFLSGLSVTQLEPSVIAVWFLRWLLFRLMFGAGMIKIRGDSCWRDLTCLQFHYETQPSPNPLSWFFHHLPAGMLKTGVLFNHFVELVVPFGFFGPRIVRHSAGILTIIFQVVLILSGNLSWLNCITIVIAIACFDDGFWTSLLPALGRIPLQNWTNLIPGLIPSYAIYALAGVIGVLSIRPALNLISQSQMMNASFEPLHIVNTYGAFGSVTRERYEVVLEGTSDSTVTSATKWQEYGFKAKPGDPARLPPQVTPYHYKLDWQMWFAAMSEYYYNPWVINLISKLLQGTPEVLGLIRVNPFPNQPPKYIRGKLYLYRFTEHLSDKNWWIREEGGEYFPAVSLDTPGFREILKKQGWL